jgi:hypothetical protein
VIQAAVADIVAPAIAADDPNALVEEIAVVLFEFLDRDVLRGSTALMSSGMIFRSSSRFLMLQDTYR